MADKPAIIQATFSDYRRVKSRKVAQLIFEVPLATLMQTVEELGGDPDEHGESSCAIARLVDEEGKTMRNFEPKTKAGETRDIVLSQEAGAHCALPKFAEFLREVKRDELEAEEAESHEQWRSPELRPHSATSDDPLIPALEEAERRGGPAYLSAKGLFPSDIPACVRLLCGVENRVQVHVLDGVVYLIAGATLIVWPGVVQTLFREEALVGHEGALMRAIGMTIVLIGWLYVFGGRSGARQIVAASVIEPVAPELERIAALEDKKGFAEVVAYLHLLGTKPLFEADAVDECIRPPPFSCHRGHAPRL